jgi:hypothetical protein
MEPEKLESLIEELDKTPEKVSALVGDLPPDVLRRQPSTGEFSAVEHVCHLYDIEREGYAVRIARLVDEERPFLRDIDGSQLALDRQYNARDLTEALRAFAHARSDNVRTLRALPRDYLSRSGTLENVGSITLGGLLLMMREHDREHVLTLARLRDFLGAVDAADGASN